MVPAAWVAKAIEPACEMWPMPCSPNLRPSRPTLAIRPPAPERLGAHRFMRPVYTVAVISTEPAVLGPKSLRPVYFFEFILTIHNPLSPMTQYAFR